MKRYLIKAGFNSTVDLERAKTLLLNCGIDRQDIDYISSPRKKGKGLKFGIETKGPLLSLRFFAFGSILGAVMYYFSLFKTSSLDFWGTILSLNISSFLLTTLIIGVAFLLIGYLIGRKYTLHTVSFKDNENDVENILMSINVDQESLDRSKEKFSEFNTTNLEIIDTKKEVEIGLRSR